jgi:hypothetical protein
MVALDAYGSVAICINIDKNLLDLIILYVINGISHIFDGTLHLFARVIVTAWQAPPVAEYSQSDVEGGEMADTTLSPQTIGEMVSKLGGLSLSPSELEELAPHLETLFSDLQTLTSIDLGEVEPETLFDVQGE